MRAGGIWQIADCCDEESGAPFNDGLTTGSFVAGKRMYVVGQWSKFVRSGWHRVGVTNTGSMLITAFESPSGTSTAVVVVNNTASGRAQVLNVGTQMGTTAVRPYLGDPITCPAVTGDILPAP